jgi:succinate dehydrogenase / fumarate reductase cytochrome b subunit
MERATRFLSSTLGMKAVVAVTGIVLFGFVVLHMLGNLKTFTGRDGDGTPHIDTYAHFLRTAGEPMLPHGFALWSFRIVLLVALVMHLAMIVRLQLCNRAARPVGYHHRPVRVVSSTAARTMLVSGILILVFVVIHLLQFTAGTIQVTPVVPEHVYANLYNAFTVWFVSLFYVIAMGLLGFHLYHGVWSLFQTLGIDNPDRNRALRVTAAASAVGLVVGFSSVPLLFTLGLMPEPPEHVETAAAATPPEQLP